MRLSYQRRLVEIGTRCGILVVGALRVDRLSRDLNSLSRNLTKLKNSLSGFVGNATFDYEEQELICRILKSVLPQMKNKKDKNTARTILNKTGWIDG